MGSKPSSRERIETEASRLREDLVRNQESQLLRSQERANSDILARGVVLVVDDEELFRDMVQRTLHREGFTVLTAADGCEAVAIFRHRSREIGCVLLDLTMPVMDGMETIRELRRIRADVPVILTSGSPDADLAQLPGDVGPTDFLQKPFRSAALVEKLRAVLARGPSIDRSE
jgi:two-component system, cell cycle sensor histidine kinase and response regulator CckA